MGVILNSMAKCPNKKGYIEDYNRVLERKTKTEIVKVCPESNVVDGVVLCLRNGQDVRELSKCPRIKRPKREGAETKEAQQLELL